MADAKTSLPPSLPPTKDDLRLAIGEPYEDTWVEGDHPTDNPDGVTNSNVDYYPKTQEEKAERLGVEMVTVIDVLEGEPYPEGDPPDEEDREAMLEQAAYAAGVDLRRGLDETIRREPQGRGRDRNRRGRAR